MSSVFKREGAWVVKWRDAAGRWRQQRTTCTSVGEARRLAADRMFQLARDGVCIAGIVTRLGDEGARTRRNLPWNRAGIRDVLHSTAYCGEWVQVYRGTPYTATVPPIIDRALFDEVQTALERRRIHVGRPYSKEVLCRALALCGVCGRTMHVGAKNSSSIYQCASRRDGKPCGNSLMHADGVDAAVWDVLAAKLRDPALIEASTAPTDTTDAAEQWHQQVAGSERKLERIEKVNVGIVEARAVGDIADTTAKARLDDLRRQRQAAETERDTARETLARLERQQFDRAALADTVEALKGCLDNADFSARQALVQSIVPQADGFGIALGPAGRIVIKGALGAAATSPSAECQARSTS